MKKMVESSVLHIYLQGGTRANIKIENTTMVDFNHCFGMNYSPSIMVHIVTAGGRTLRSTFSLVFFLTIFP